MIDRTQLQRRAQRKLLAIQRRRRDARYQRVVGRLIAEGLLNTNQEVSLSALSEQLQVSENQVVRRGLLALA